MFLPDLCFEKDTRKTIVRVAYVLIFNTWRDQDFVDLCMGSTEIWLRPASSIKRYDLIYRLHNFFVVQIKAK